MKSLSFTTVNWSISSLLEFRWFCSVSIEYRLLLIECFSLSFGSLGSIVESNLLWPNAASSTIDFAIDKNVI